MPALTNKQKAALVSVLLGKAGDIVEYWHEAVDGEPDLHEVDCHEAALCLTRWLRHLPGSTWDKRLPFPTVSTEVQS